MTGERRDPYPTDLTDRQWRLVEPLLPGGQTRGRPRHINLREVVNALLYVRYIRCPWRFLPRDLPPWPTVYTYDQRWSADGTLERILAAIGWNQDIVSQL